MTKIKADLHMHGPIEFQPYWLRVQGYAGKNLLQLLTDKCISRGIGICAVTSQADEITPRSVHDRFWCLKEQEALLLDANYKHDSIGENIFVVEKMNERVYFVNGQTVMPIEDGKKFDILVVGSNKIPNGMPIKDTLNYGEDNGLIRIAEHPFVETHRGMGEKLLEKYVDDFDAIEGHNSQMIFRYFTTKVPFFGKSFSHFGRELNFEAKVFALGHDKASVATSDAHRIQDAGLSYIEWQGKICDSNEEKFMKDLRNRIASGGFYTMERYESFLSWINWVIKFQKGIKSGKVVNEYVCSKELN